MSYSKQVMEHFLNPRNVGALPDANGVGVIGSARCGDVMKLYLRIEDGTIADAGFETFGCASAIASSSVTTELIKGKSVQKALTLTAEQVDEALGGLPEDKQHCARQAAEAVRAAIREYGDERGDL